MIGSGRVNSLAILAILVTALMMGCGQKAGYPTAKAVSALNQPGECAYCQRKIARVGPENLVTYDGVEYIVCDETCAAAQKLAAGH
ncbi:MAG TPA: hypothetical protein VMR25_01025 [Planctomycetaceae bacterium]|jgi:hypothetical protein|nr:hypothetical protein [Planctomycetaceae bacterium]